MKRFVPLILSLVACAALVACASSAPPQPRPGYAGNNGSSSSSVGNHSSVPTNHSPESGPIAISANVMGSVRQIDLTTTEVTVTARGPQVGDAEAEGKVVAARAALASNVVDTIEQDGGWRRAAMSNTSIKSMKKTVMSGGVELQLVVTVFQKNLLEWAREKGYARRTESVSADVPAPEIMIVPEMQAGKWPERLDPEQALIYSTIQEFIASRDIQTYDYATYYEAVQGELANSSGAMQIDENYLIGGDLYVKYSYSVEPGMGNTIKAQVRVQGVMTVTAQNVTETTEWSREMSSAQRSAAIKEAALKAANKCVSQLLDTYNREYARGVPYRISISNVPEDIELDVSDFLQNASEGGRRLSNYQYRDGVINCLVYSKTNQYGDPREFRRFLRDQLADLGSGYTLRNQMARSRFIFGELQPK